MESQQHEGYRPRANVSPSQYRFSGSYPMTEERPLVPERAQALKDEVDKLVRAGFIREVKYPV